MENSSTSAYIQHLDLVIIWCAVIPFFIEIIITTINALLLARKCNYWYRMRTKAEYINDDNYRTATVNYIKYGLCSLMLILEVVLFLSITVDDIGSTFECQHPDRVYCSLLITLQDLLHSYNSVSLIVLLSIFHMLSIFLINAIADSKIDTGILYRESWKTFWLCIAGFSLCGSGISTISNIGFIMTSVVHLYLLRKIIQRARKLFKTLRSRCMEYTHDARKFRYYRAQVRHYKWSSVIVCGSLGFSVVSIALWTIYSNTCKVFYSITSFQLGYPDTLYSELQAILGYIIITELLSTLQRISLVTWLLVSMLLNCILLITFIRQAFLYRRSMSIPFHVKLIDSDDRRITYEIVTY